MITSYAIFTAAMAVLVYLVKRYISAQDKRYEALNSNFEELTKEFIDSVQDLKGLINELKIATISHRTLCDERHGGIKDRVVQLEETLRNVRLFKPGNN